MPEASIAAPDEQWQEVNVGKIDFAQERWAVMKASGLPKPEKDYRLATLRALERKYVKEGPHEARAHSDRARQFMPFAALKGYEKLIETEETDSVTRTEGTPSRERTR